MDNPEGQNSPNISFDSQKIGTRPTVCWLGKSIIETLIQILSAGMSLLVNLSEMVVIHIGINLGCGYITVSQHLLNAL